MIEAKRQCLFIKDVSCLDGRPIRLSTTYLSLFPFCKHIYNSIDFIFGFACVLAKVNVDKLRYARQCSAAWYRTLDLGQIYIYNTQRETTCALLVGHIDGCNPLSLSLKKRVGSGGG